MGLTVGKTYLQELRREMIMLLDEEGEQVALFAKADDAEMFIYVRERFAGEAMLQTWNRTFQAALSGGADNERAITAADAAVQLALGGHIAKLVASAIKNTDATDEGAGTL